MCVCVCEREREREREKEAWLAGGCFGVEDVDVGGASVVAHLFKCQGWRG